MIKESINGNLYVECVSKIQFYWKLKIKQKDKLEKNSKIYPLTSVQRYG